MPPTLTHTAPIPFEGRLDWLDALKGLSIFLVVLGHSLVFAETDSAAGLYWKMQTFRMPFFFMLAGLASCIVMQNKSTGFWGFIGIKLRSILLPYACWLLLKGLMFEPSGAWLNYNIDYRWDAFYRGTENIWFLPCLFALQVIYGLFRSIKTKFNLGLITSILLLTALWALLLAAHLTWGKTSPESVKPLEWLTNAYLYYPSFFAGILLAEFKQLRDFLLCKPACITVALIATLLLIGKIPTMPQECYAQQFLGIVVGLLLIRFVCSYQIPSAIYKQMIFIGKNTLIIYVVGGIFQSRHLTMFPDFNGCETLAIFSVISLLICYACILLSKFIELSPLLTTLLLGRKFKRASQQK